MWNGTISKTTHLQWFHGNSKLEPVQSNVVKSDLICKTWNHLLHLKQNNMIILFWLSLICHSFCYVNCLLLLYMYHKSLHCLCDWMLVLYYFNVGNLLPFIFKYLVVFVLMEFCYLWLLQSISPQMEISWLANIATFREMQFNVHWSLGKKKNLNIVLKKWDLLNFSICDHTFPL